jgi:hypothetical protein
MEGPIHPKLRQRAGRQLHRSQAPPAHPPSQGVPPRTGGDAPPYKCATKAHQTARWRLLTPTTLPPHLASLLCEAPTQHRHLRQPCSFFGGGWARTEARPRRPSPPLPRPPHPHCVLSVTLPCSCFESSDQPQRKGELQVRGGELRARGGKLSSERVVASSARVVSNASRVGAFCTTASTRACTSSVAAARTASAAVQSCAPQLRRALRWLVIPPGPRWGRND